MILHKYSININNSISSIIIFVQYLKSFSFDFTREVLSSENSYNANKEEESFDSEQFSDEDSSNIISNSSLKIGNTCKYFFLINFYYQI